MPAPKQVPEAKKADPVKPRHGKLVRIKDEPGVWQILDRTPVHVFRTGWWLSPFDEAARAAHPHPNHGAYRAAVPADMTAHNG